MTAASVIAAVVLTATTIAASWLDGKGNKNHFASVSWFTYFMHLLVHVSGDSLATKHRKNHWEDDEVRANRHGYVSAMQMKQAKSSRVHSSCSLRLMAKRAASAAEKLSKPHFAQPFRAPSPMLRKIVQSCSL